MDVLPAQIAKAQSIMSVSQTAWDSERWMDRSVLDERPILPLVEAFLVDSDLGRRKLTWLCLFAARRALPAWKLYCDGERPRLALDALTEYLRDGVPCDPNFAVAEPPAIHGSPIVDCRAADTGCAAEAAALAVKFSLSGDPLDAMECLSAADGALDQSPLGNQEQFRRWFSSIAIPAAWANRGLSPTEQESFRSYDPDSLATEGGTEP